MLVLGHIQQRELGRGEGLLRIRQLEEPERGFRIYLKEEGEEEEVRYK